MISRNVLVMSESTTVGLIENKSNVRISCPTNRSIRVILAVSSTSWLSSSRIFFDICSSDPGCSPELLMSVVYEFEV
eukprot:m.18419 g.18419  ORF g.18419 m.18419 type:complete len:77 (-) comp7359_c0_seq1:57-287(-)